MADRGIWIRDTAQEMSVDALAELLALAQTTQAAGRESPHFEDHRKSAPHDWLAMRGLVLWRSCGRSRWDLNLSRDGWLVLLARVEADLTAVGRLPADEECEDA